MQFENIKIHKSIFLDVFNTVEVKTVPKTEPVVVSL